MPPSALIISEDNDFYPVLMEQVALQLGWSCDHATELSNVNKMTVNHDVIVSDQDIGVSDWGRKLIIADRKPLRLQDLLAQMTQLVHKAGSPETHLLGHGCTIHVRRKIIMHEATGKSSDVTDKEMQLLTALMQAGDAGISREQLLKDVWGFDEAVDTHTLETHIYRLRGKCKDISNVEHMIEAIDGGYRIKT